MTMETEPLREDAYRVRYERLTLVIQKALEQTINKSLSIDQVSRCYPKIAKTRDGLKSLQVARKQVRTFLEDTCTKEFALIFSEHDIENKLNELDDIIQSAHVRKQEGLENPIEVDRLSASEIIEANLIESKHEVVEKLSMMYRQLCIDNVDLFNQLKAKSEESESIKRDINSSIANLTSGIDDARDEQLDKKLNDLIDQVLSHEDI